MVVTFSVSFLVWGVFSDLGKRKFFNGVGIPLNGVGGVIFSITIGVGALHALGIIKDF